MKLVDCATASAAVPTYFEPWEVPGAGECVDGGVGIAGNPVYKTCVEAFYFTPPGTYVPADTIVVSLGTGHHDGRYHPNNLLDWVLWSIGALLRAPAEQQTELVLRHFATAATYRLDVTMPRGIEMDDIGAVPELVKIGREFAAGIDWKNILAGVHNQWTVKPPEFRGTITEMLR
jgi:hypothetical protein